MEKTTRKGLALLLTLALCTIPGAWVIPATASSPGNTKMTSTIGTGRYHTAAVKEDGTLWTWGLNDYGQLGTGNKKNSSSPVKVMADVVSVSCGMYHTAAIKVDGSLWIWGNNNNGQLGIGGGGNDTTFGGAVQTSPVKVLDNVSAVSCGSFYTAAIKEDGTLWLWGKDQFDLTQSLSVADYTIPTKVMDGVAYVSCAQASMYSNIGVIKTDGTLWMWGGTNDFGQLGYGNTTASSTPKKVLDNVASVCVGSNHTMAVKTDGTLWTWGKDDYGQLGDGNTKNVTSPKQVMTGVSAVACENFHSAVLKTDGTVWTWGKNGYGQLGIGSTTDSTKPTQVLSGVTAITCSNQFAALKTDGTVWTWGDNTYGQTGNGNTNSVTTPVKVLSSVALPTGDGLVSTQSSSTSTTTSTTTSTSTAGKTVSGSVSSGVSVESFSDVYDTDYYAEAVEWAKEKGVTSGTGNGLFSPATTVTRAQAMTFLWVAAGSPEPSSGVARFVDASSAGTYYYKPVLWATEMGITSGVDSTHFGVNETVSYDQMLAFLCKASGGTLTWDWSLSAQNWARENGLTDGVSYSAKAGCTRADVVYFLWKKWG